jgi:S1-C subfamily serine protease
VEQVRKGSPADRAGLRANDILLQVDGKAVPHDAGELRQLLDGLEREKEVEAVILRQGKQQTIKGLRVPGDRPRGPGPRR